MINGDNDAPRSPNALLPLFAGALLCGASLTVCPALADDDDNAGGAPAISYPYLKGELEIEIKSTDIFQADDEQDETSQSETEMELSTGFFFNEYLSLKTTLKVQPVEEVEGKDSHFEKHGLFLQEIYGDLSLGRVSAFGGKFNLNFGRAWAGAPGVFLEDYLKEAYKITERAGFGASAKVETDALGEVTVTAGVFKADTSNLSQSILTTRGKLDVDDGGFGNTEALENFNIAIDGAEIPSLPGVSYHIGYVHQGRGRIGDLDPGAFARLSDQNGFALGLFAEREYNNAKFELFGEAVYFDNYLLEGEEAVRDIYFLTVGGKLAVNKYNLSLTYTHRPYELDGEHFEDRLATVAVGYEIRDDLLVQIGYGYQTDEGKDAHIAGVKLSTEVDFASR